MEALVRASVALRRAARRGLPVLAILALGAFWVTDSAAPVGRSLLFAAAGGWAGAFCWGAAHGILPRAGGLSGPLYPIVYVLVALVCTFSRPVPAALVLGMLLL